MAKPIRTDGRKSANPQAADYPETEQDEAAKQEEVERELEEEQVETGLEDSFPGSDPVSVTSSTTAGGPRRTKTSS